MSAFFVYSNPKFVMIKVMGVGITKTFLILLQGLGILGVALILNIFATKFGIKTWYGFVAEPSNTNLISIVWLFLVYPFALGATAYLIGKFLYK